MEAKTGMMSSAGLPGPWLSFIGPGARVALRGLRNVLIALAAGLAILSAVFLAAPESDGATLDLDDYPVTWYSGYSFSDDEVIAVVSVAPGQGKANTSESDASSSTGLESGLAEYPYDATLSFVAPTSLVKIPSRSNTKLQNYVDQLFKHANQPGRIGDGATMAALPSELAAGAGPHIQKATEIRNGLSRWLTTSAGQNASAADRAIAQDLFDQLDELLP